ncbi:Uu.00g100830.m01.CDS01 [Anthostomella pinea]|uniref:Uu.00g100830.m01.CDS01 n=1 Tax=Anthostomella pinea TaxID=933095 RepID=A0AAI8V7Z4_9PEZI|nr:Uu.00g100830.m01.CDS01 [Anthostomella pinea]
MENLLSLAFDNLSSFDGPKIRKGLKQVEGLLANICLSRQQPNSKDKGRRASTVAKDPGQQDQSQEPPPTKTLSELTDDPAFYEFFKLQEGFEWNVAMRLVTTLDRLLAKGGDGSNDLLMLSALDLIQGVMLLHPPSKALFSREMCMNMLLDLLEPDFCPAIQSATLLTLVTALIDTPQNTRTFENLDGLLAVTSLFRSRGTSRDVKLKLIEFLYFYLMPEVPSIPSAVVRDSVPGLLQRSPSKLAKAFSGFANGNGGEGTSRRRPRSDSDDCQTRSQEEKQLLLGRHLNSVEELVKDLRQSTPFGGVVC